MTVAGQGAEEQAARAGERVAQLRRQLDSAERVQRAWQAGAEGERRVGAALDALTGEGWVVLHDVRWPGRQRANLDHVAVGPGGVVVVDAKNWSGAVTVRDGVLRCGGYRKDDQLDGVAAASAAVAAVLPPRTRTAVRGLLCLVQQRVELTPTAAGVPVVGVEGVADVLRGLPPRLAPSEVRRTARLLRAATTAPAPPAPARRRSSAPARTVLRRTGGRTRLGARLLDALLRVVAVAVVAVVGLAVLPHLVQHAVERTVQQVTEGVVQDARGGTGP